jgi:hypothetical protein
MRPLERLGALKVKPTTAADHKRAPGTQAQASQMPADVPTLKAQLKQALSTTKRDALRTWCRSDGCLAAEDLHAALRALGLKASSAAAAALFRSLADGRATVPAQHLLKALHAPPPRRAASAGSAVALAVDLGVRLAETTVDERARELEFVKRPTAASAVDRFAWEPASQHAQQHDGPQPYWLVGDPRFDTPAALERRVALLRSGRVVRACRQFWDTLRLGADEQLERATYEDVHRLL